jgi:release factor glutamine methyltransferase
VPTTEALLLDILNKASDWFKSKGVENHRLDAQILLGHVLGMKRMDLYMNFDRPLNDTELASYRELVRRRGAREPLQHLVGTVAFRELTLKVDRRALIPRQETEIIVDLVRKMVLLGKANTVLDIGVGAGPIFLSIQKEIPNCRAYGVDISQDCLDLTRENAVSNGLNGEDLALGSLFEPFALDDQWDIIVSNPPYVGSDEIKALEPEVRDYDPISALVGGPEGWELPLRIIDAAYPHLHESGTLILEIGAGQFSILKQKIQAWPWQSCTASLDYSGIERFLILQK